MQVPMAITHGRDVYVRVPLRSCDTTTVLAGGDGAVSTRTEPVVASSSTLPFDDYMQITDWFSTYASTVDRKKWSAFPNLFTKCIHRLSRKWGFARERNRDETLAGNSISIFSASQHLISNIQVVTYIDHRNVEVRAMFFNPMNVVFCRISRFLHAADGTTTSLSKWTTEVA